MLMLAIQFKRNICDQQMAQKHTHIGLLLHKHTPVPTLLFNHRPLLEQSGAP